MSTFTKPELRRTAWVAGIVTAVGFILVLATSGSHRPEDFWQPYILATGRIGALLLIFGFIWTALALAHLRTSFFDPTRPMDGGQFGGAVAAVLVAVVILIAVLLPRIPRTAPSQLSADPKQRAATVSLEHNFRSMVALSLIIAGAAVLYVPGRRFFGK